MKLKTSGMFTLRFLLLDVVHSVHVCESVGFFLSLLHLNSNWKWWREDFPILFSFFFVIFTPSYHGSLCINIEYCEIMGFTQRLLIVCGIKWIAIAILLWTFFLLNSFLPPKKKKIPSFHRFHHFTVLASNAHDCF